jgi:hypothetical protein
MAQENRSLRTRIDEFLANGSKLNRQWSDLESRRDDLTRAVEELEATLSHELRLMRSSKMRISTPLSRRLTASNLPEELAALTSRSEAAEQLLEEARANLRERDAEIRRFEQQRALESSRAAKSKDVTLADLEIWLMRSLGVPEEQRKRSIEGRDARRKIDNFLPNRLRFGMVFQKVR